MREVSVQIFVILLLALSVIQCSSESVVLLIHVNNITPDVNTLQVDVVMNNKPAKQSALYTQRLSQVAVTLPRGTIGNGDLSIRLFGLDADGCKLSGVRHDSHVSVETSFIEADLSLTVLSSKICTLTVERLGGGTVRFIPLGIECPDRCVVELPLNTKVMLNAAHTAVAEWEGACTGRQDTCELTMTTSQRVKVQWGTELHPKMIRVTKGSFAMGSSPTEPEHSMNEQQHLVAISGDFLISETEVTQGQYRNVIARNPSYFRGDQLPVEQVSWLDSIVFCNSLSLKESLTPCYQIHGMDAEWNNHVKCTGYRLPTEAEWEYAARASSSLKYAGSDNADDVAWYDPTAGDTTHAVKSKKANSLGLYDLSGNVFEWVWDRYLDNYETLESTDPAGPEIGYQRVLRGGSWGASAWAVRVANRSRDNPNIRSQNLGFRLVRSLL